MTGEPLHTDANRSARRQIARQNARQNSRRPATRTIARFGLMVSLPGATVLAATAGPTALASANGRHGHSGTASPRAVRAESPLVKMRRILEAEQAATTTTTSPPAPPPPSTTVPSPPLAAVAAAPVPAPAPRTAPPPPPPHPAPPPPAPVKPPVPVTHPAPPPPPPPTPTAGLLPPANPAASIVANPPFESTCLADGALSAPCFASTLQATDTARGREGLGPLSLPGNYSALTPAEQLFVLADSERVDRGLPPAVGLVAEFDQDAQAAAQANTDPGPTIVPPGVGILRWASNWGENAGALGSNYNWMYDDGPGSGNLACGGGGGGCWGHRDNILGFSASELAASGGTLVMGAGEASPPSAAPWMSDAELFAVITHNPAYYIYTWGQAVAAGAR
jgi:outer membrane biosynthesis protein TonB